MKCAKLLFTIFMVGFLLQSCSEDHLDSPLVEDEPEEQLDLVMKRNCGMSDHILELKKNPDYEKNQLAKYTRLDELVQTRANCSTPEKIPVAFHFQGASGATRSCLELMVAEEIQALNADFHSLNSDLSKWNAVKSNYGGIANGSACIEFVLATKNHPSGYGLTEGSGAITINKTSGDYINAFAGYVNVIIRSNINALGYAPLGGNGNGDGVVIQSNAFGSKRSCGNVGAQTPFDKGRTLTHEMGHYFLLDHIWGNGCSVDDGIADTPDQSQENYGCPTGNTSSCGSRDLFMNYMDYVNDDCMYMFTSGQATRMSSYLQTSLANVKNKANSVLGQISNGGDDTTDDDSGSDEDDSSDAPSDDNTDDNNQCGNINANVTVIGNNGLRFQWQAEPGATRYQIQYRPKGGSWRTRRLASTVVQIGGLQSGTIYQYRTRTRCASGWTPHSAIKNIEIPSDDIPDNSTCVDMNLSIVLDVYGSEISWLIRDAANKRVASGSGYTDGDAGRTINEKLCLPDGCYSLIFKDSYGDGFCCDYGFGSFTLTAGNRTLAEEIGEFGYRLSTTFCTNSAKNSQVVERDAKDASKPRKH